MPEAHVSAAASAPRAISFQLTPADVQALHEALYRPGWGARHWGRHERLRLVLAGMALATLVVLLLKLFARNKLGADVVGWEAIVSALLGGAVAGWWWGKHHSRLPAAGSTIYQPQTVQIGPEGVHLHGEGYDVQVAWEQVASLRDVGGCLLIHTRVDASPMVPLRAFASAPEAAAFVAEAIALRGAALNVPPHQAIEQWRYRLTRDDVAAFLALKRGPRRWQAPLFYSLLFASLAVTGALIDDADDGTFWAGLAAGVAVPWLLVRLVLIIERRVALARFPLPEGDTEMQRWGDHLRVTADGRTEHVAYELIGNVVVGDEHVFILTSPTAAVIVPKRAFASSEEMQQFGDQVDEASNDAVP